MKTFNPHTSAVIPPTPIITYNQNNDIINLSVVLKRGGELLEGLGRLSLSWGRDCLHVVKAILVP